MLDKESTYGTARELGQRLREARRAKRWTLRQAAVETGISNGYLSLIEQGEVKAPSPRYLLALADRYELPYDELMALAGHPSGPRRTKLAGRDAPAALSQAGRNWSGLGVNAVFGTVGRIAEREGSLE